MRNNKTTYEAPEMNVTVIEADDVIMASGTTLINLDDPSKLMGKGKVEWIDIN